MATMEVRSFRLVSWEKYLRKEKLMKKGLVTVVVILVIAGGLLVSRSPSVSRLALPTATVQPSGSIQNAVNAAQPGEIVTVEAGAR